MGWSADSGLTLGRTETVAFEHRKGLLEALAAQVIGILQQWPNPGEKALRRALSEDSASGGQHRP